MAANSGPDKGTRNLVIGMVLFIVAVGIIFSCLLYTSPSPRDGLLSRMPSSA